MQKTSPSKFTLKISLATAFAFTTVVATSGFADEWPQYRGAKSDGKSAETIGEIDWSDGPKVLWKKPTELGFSSFSISNAKAFTLVVRDGAQTCIAMNADTGEELWKHSFSKSDYGRGGGDAGAPGNKGGDGPRSTPSVDGDHVYIYDGQMILACLNAEDGKLVWQQDLIKDFGGRIVKWANATSPLVDGDLVFVGGGGSGQSMIAFNKTTGEPVWKTGDELFTHATPIATTINEKKQIIFFMQSGLISVNPEDGKEIWRSAFPYSVSTAASPVVDGNNVFCSAGYGVGAGLYKIDTESKVEEVWRRPNRLINHWSTPVVYDGHLYGMFAFKKYGKGPLQCIELATGEIKWEKRGFGPGNCIIVSDKVIALSDSGEVVVVDASPNEYKEIARAKVLNGKCWSTPAYSDGRIYVRSTEEGACISLK